MIGIPKFWKNHNVRLYVGLAALGVSIGLYAAVLGSFENYKLALVLVVLPIFLGSIILRDAPTILFSLLLVSLSLSARFRPPGYDFHPGGAELSLAPMDFPLLVLLLLCLPQIVKRPEATKATVKALSWPFALFLACHLVSIIPASDFGLALLEVLRLLKMGLLVLVVCHYLDSVKKIEFAIGILLLTVILQGTLAVFQSVFRTSLGLGFLGEHEYVTISKGAVAFGRAGGTLGHPNVLANFFELCTPIALAIILFARTGRRGPLQPLAYGALLAGITGTFLALSRAGWVSLFLGLSVVVFQYLKGRRVFRITPGLLATTLVMGLIGLVSAGVIVTRLTEFWEGSRLVRVLTARTALNMLRSNPILGVGANNYLNVSTTYVDPDLSVGLARRAVAVVHNVVLLYAAELGLVGLVSFVFLLLWVLWLARRIAQRGDRFLASVSVGVLAGMIALVAHGMWDWLFRYDPVYTFFWFNVGLLIATRNIILKESLHQEEVGG